MYVFVSRVFNVEVGRRNILFKTDWKYFSNKLVLAAVSLYSEIPSVRISGIAILSSREKRPQPFWIFLSFVTQIFYKGFIIIFHSFSFFPQLFIIGPIIRFGSALSSTQYCHFDVVAHLAVNPCLRAICLHLDTGICGRHKLL